jgi:glucuronosyltransferase
MTTNIRPTVPSYHQIAFIHVEQPKPLKDDNIKQFLDEATMGVILVSFGSIPKDFPEILFKKFTDTFQELPFRVIFKADSSNYKNVIIPKNIMISKWFPLSDILAHPNVKVLICHGGIKSIEEAIDREVPMVLMPINFDQPCNTFLQLRHKIAVSLDLNTFTKDSLTEALMEVIKPEYKINIRKVKTLAYDKMSSSLDEAVENIEYLIEHEEQFEFQLYEGRCSSDRSELFYDIFWMIGRFLLLIVHAAKYFT